MRGKAGLGRVSGPQQTPAHGGPQQTAASLPPDSPQMEGVWQEGRQAGGNAQPGTGEAPERTEASGPACGPGTCWLVTAGQREAEAPIRRP